MNEFKVGQPWRLIDNQFTSCFLVDYILEKSLPVINAIACAFSDIVYCNGLYAIVRICHPSSV